MKTSSFAFLFASTLLGACATDAQQTQPGNDELAGETGDGESPKADGTDNFGFLALQKTGAFTCQGLNCVQYRVTRANRSTVGCFDGIYRTSCEFQAVAWDTMKLAQDKVDAVEAAIQREAEDPTIGTQVLVRGTWKNYVEMTAFVPTEVWIAGKANGDDSGTFVRIVDKNIRCITAPCPTFEEGRLSSSRSMLISGLDFGITAKNSIEDAFEARVYDALETAEGAIVVGNRSTTGSGYKLERYRTVGQVYLPVK